MFRSQHVLIALAAVSILAALGAVSARAEPLSPEQARDLVRNGDILPLGAVLGRVSPPVEGEIIAVALVREGGRYLYKIKALGADGRYRERRADAKAGTSADDP